MGKLALNFICKDESPVIEKMLDSAKGIVDLIVVNDTGSTDGTQQIIKNFGYSKWADPDNNEDEEDPDNIGYKELGIFEGNPNDEKNEYRTRMINHFYG